MSTRSAHNAMHLPALATLVLAIGACGSAAANSAPSSAAGAVPPSSAVTVASPSTTGTAVSPSSAATVAPPSTTGTAAAPTAAPLAFTGYVQQIYATGDFILDDGQVTYTVLMSPTTSVVNLRGVAIPWQAISVSGMVKVTGTLADSKISAQTVLVPTRKDGRDP